MSFSGSMIQNAIYIAQQPPEWPVAFEDWERAAEEKLDAGRLRLHRGRRGRRVDDAREPRRVRPLAPASADARRERVSATSRSRCSACARRRRSSSRRSACSRSRTRRPRSGSRKAAASSGVPMVLSSAATHSIEEVAATNAPRWFQLYWVNDREICASFVQRAEAAGYGAIVVTLDTLTLGWRPRDLRQAYLPFIRGEGCGQYFSDPVFLSRLDKTPEEDLLTAAATMLATFPNLGLDLGRPRLAARADGAADPRQGRADRRRRAARARSTASTASSSRTTAAVRSTAPSPRSTRSSRCGTRCPTRSC